MKKILLIAISLIGFTALQAAEYHVEKSKDNLVKFISDAPLEDFEGVTEKIDGFLLTKRDDSYRDAEIYFEVDLNSIETGIGLRDNHMRDNYLYTDKWPFAKYEGKITKATRNSQGNFDVTAKGVFEVKGEKEDKEITAVISENGELLNIKTQFIVNLKDHDIEVPSLMGAKISENIDLRVNFRMKKVN